ncbi:hypothetical protein [Stappia sp.]|uniref:hypothetical protein n=1 Tax=Stappia sp. TaxID=1870903 RepID=UPI0032D92BCF
MESEQPAWPAGRAPAHDSRRKMRFPIGRSRPIERNAFTLNILQHSVVGGAGQLLRNLLMPVAVVRPAGMQTFMQPAFARTGAIPQSATFDQRVVPS